MVKLVWDTNFALEWYGMPNSYSQREDKGKCHGSHYLKLWSLGDTKVLLTLPWFWNEIQIETRHNSLSPTLNETLDSCRKPVFNYANEKLFENDWSP